MQRLLLAVDRLSTWLGQIFAWTIVLLTLLITYEVFSATYSTSRTTGT